MRVLVLGAYGLIGHEISRVLISEKVTVTGLARSFTTGRALLPQAEWITADISTLITPDAWKPHLKGIDAVVNAAGVLQSGSKDNVRAVQQDAMTALFDACVKAGIQKVIQISAPAVSTDAKTEFMRTKAAADNHLQQTSLDWVILRPGVVISHTAYGGTALLRMLAAFPIIQPLFLGEAKMQTIHVNELAQAVARCLKDESLNKQVFDLLEDDIHDLRNVILSFRSWLGFQKPSAVIQIPNALGFFVARIADLSGLMGWRSPLRTTALKVLSDGIMGDPEPWHEATGQTFKSLDDTLDTLHSSPQERLFARIQLIFPLLVAILSIFWIMSGIIGLISYAQATALVAKIVGDFNASLLLFGGAFLDILIGLGLLWRRSFKFAVLCSIGLSMTYLASGTIMTPHIWLDPLGPFVKIFPVIAASLCLLALSEDR